MTSQEYDALIQRYTAGERDPGLLALLDAAAWECFHDPWEARPADPGLEQALGQIISVLDAIGAQEPPRAAAGSRSRRAAEALDPALAAHLVTCLASRGWPATLDPAGAVRCLPDLPGPADRDLVLRLSLDSRRMARLCFYMTSAWPVPESARRGARGFCDQWNQGGRALNARMDMPLSCPGQPRPPQGALILDRQLELPPQFPFEAVSAFLDRCLAEAGEFWAAARLELGRWNRN